MAARTAAGEGARSGWKWVKKPLGMSELGCADGCGRCGCKGVAGNGVGEEAAGDERAWLGGEKKPLGMRKLGCADGCRRRSCKEVVGNGWGEGEKTPLRMSELGCADGCGRRGCNGVAGDEAGNGEKKMLGMSELGCAGGRGRRAREWLDMDGGEEAAGDERPWLRGWLLTAWVQGGGWKWAGRRSGWE